MKTKHQTVQCTLDCLCHSLAFTRHYIRHHPVLIFSMCMLPECCQHCKQSIALHTLRSQPTCLAQLVYVGGGTCCAFSKTAKGNCNAKIILLVTTLLQSWYKYKTAEQSGMVWCCKNDVGSVEGHWGQPGGEHWLITTLPCIDKLLGPTRQKSW